MRLLAVLYLVFLVQATLAQEGTATNRDASGDAGPSLTRRKRGWGWSSSTSNRATKRPIGWSAAGPEIKPKRRPYVQAPPPPPPPAGPVQQPYYVQQAPAPVYVVPGQTYVYPMVRPTKSLSHELVKAALVIGTVGAVKAYVKPVVRKPAAERAEQREARRLLRKNRSTTVAPSTNVTSTAVPLAQSDLIPVMVQDANKLFQVMYVPRDKIPPGAIPIATAPSFPIGPGSGVPQGLSPFGFPGQQPTAPGQQPTVPGQQPIPPVGNPLAPPPNTTTLPAA